MTTASQELPQYSNTLSRCATLYDTSCQSAIRKNNEIGYSPATMKNLLSVANNLEDIFGLKTKRDPQYNIGIENLAGFMNDPMTPISELTLLFHPVADESSLITAQDFTDSRTIPDNYTFGRYVNDRLPLLSRLLPTIRTRDFQDNTARPIIIERIKQEIAEKRKLLDGDSRKLGVRVARDEISVLEAVLGNLTQTISLPSDIRPI